MGRPRKTPEDYSALAVSRGFVWLGPEVRSITAKTGWQCPKLHEWQGTYNDIYHSGSGCPHCANCVRKVSADYHSLAKEHGFEWMGPEVKGVMAKTGWKCAKGHEWQSRYNDIKTGYGCPYCGGHGRKTPEDYLTLALEKGYEWLGPFVEKVNITTSWKCGRGHVFKSRYNSLQQGQGCPRCVHHISEPEAELRELVRLALPETIGNIRGLLKNKKFELDIYLPSLKKAVEYDGWRHTLEANRERDARKDRECVEAGIKLLRVTHEEYRSNPEETLQKVLYFLSTPPERQQPSLPPGQVELDWGLDPSAFPPT